MSLIEKYLGKQAEQLKYSDIQIFFQIEREESDKIEFKAFHNLSESLEKKKAGIIRSICGFLNSGGGIIIWGSPLGINVEGKKEKIFVGDLSPADTVIEKDAIINKISDSVTPTPNNVIFLRLESEESYIYVFEVTASEYSPHQFNNTYFMRLDGQTRPAPHHYIEALFKKITYPKLKGYIKLHEFTQNTDKVFLGISPFILNLSKLQNEYNLYYRIYITKGVFQRSIGNINPHAPYGMNGHEKRVLNALDVLYYSEPYENLDVISFDRADIKKGKNVIQILLYFGGKQSPLIFSKYTLKLDLDYIGTNHLNSMITELQENVYLYDNPGSLNYSDEEKIKRHLGR